MTNFFGKIYYSILGVVHTNLLGAWLRISVGMWVAIVRDPDVVRPGMVDVSSNAIDTWDRGRRIASWTSSVAHGTHTSSIRGMAYLSKQYCGEFLARCIFEFDEFSGIASSNEISRVVCICERRWLEFFELLLDGVVGPITQALGICIIERKFPFRRNWTRFRVCAHVMSLWGKGRRMFWDDKGVFIVVSSHFAARVMGCISQGARILELWSWDERDEAHEFV